MKPTDEERREVARRLRANAEKHPKMQLILNVAFACDSLRPEGAMDWNVTSHDAAMYLADLIEPEPERTCGECEEFRRCCDCGGGWCMELLEPVNEADEACDEHDPETDGRSR